MIYTYGNPSQNWGLVNFMMPYKGLYIYIFNCPPNILEDFGRSFSHQKINSFKQIFIFIIELTVKLSLRLIFFSFWGRQDSSVACEFPEDFHVLWAHTVTVPIDSNPPCNHCESSFPQFWKVSTYCVKCSGGPLDNMSIRARAIILKSFTEAHMLFSNCICF